MCAVFVYGPDHDTIAENVRRLFPEAEVSCSESPAPTALERMLSARKMMDSMTRRLLEQSAQETSQPQVAAPAVE